MDTLVSVCPICKKQYKIGGVMFEKHIASHSIPYTGKRCVICNNPCPKINKTCSRKCLTVYLITHPHGGNAGKRSNFKKEIVYEYIDSKY